MFGLADQIRCHMYRVGGGVGQDRDLGRAGLGVDTDLRAADPLGCRHVDIARPGDHVDRCEFGAVGIGATESQERHALRAAHRPHLVHAQQFCRRQNGGVRQATEPRLRWAGDDQ